MQTKLVGYLLNALEEDELQIVEELLAENEEAQRQLNILRWALLPLGGSTTLADHPRDLGIRTCKLLRELRRTRL